MSAIWLCSLHKILKLTAKNIKISARSTLFTAKFWALVFQPRVIKILDLATFIHVTNAPHHPEYWTETDLSGFTRGNFTPNGIVDATEMPEECLLEMLADWCSVGLEKGNTPFEWFDKVNGIRWLFDEYQQKFIKVTLEKMWGGLDEQINLD